jgi:hypothetical protein
MAGPFVRLNIRIVQKEFAVFDPRKRIVQVRQAGSDGFDFGSAEFNSSLYFIEDLIVVVRPAIRSNLRGHCDREPERRALNCVAGFGQEFKGKFAVDNFFQGYIGIRHTRSHFYERPMPRGELSHPFRNEIYEQGSVWNEFGSFLEELAGHSIDHCPQTGARSSNDGRD